MLASEPPLIKIRSIFLCISLCKARNILSPVGDAVGSDTYFVFRDSAATAAIAAAWSVFSGGGPDGYRVDLGRFIVGIVHHCNVVEVILASITSAVRLRFTRMAIRIE